MVRVGGSLALVVGALLSLGVLWFYEIGIGARFGHDDEFNTGLLAYRTEYYAPGLAHSAETLKRKVWHQGKLWATIGITVVTVLGVVVGIRRLNRGTSG